MTEEIICEVCLKEVESIEGKINYKGIDYDACDRCLLVKKMEADD